MKSSLYTRLNLESGDSVVDVDNILPSMSLTPLDTEGDVLINDCVALEAASVQIVSVIETAEELAEKGVASTVIDNTLAPVAVASIATVDSEAAEDVGDAVVSMEDGSPSVWQKIKEKLLAIWEAFKGTFTRFWNWLKSFFVKAEATEKEATVKVAQATKAFEEAKNETKDMGTLLKVEFPCLRSWTIDNKPLNPKTFCDDAVFFKKQFSVANADLFKHVRKVYDDLKNKADDYTKEFARVASLNIPNSTQEQFENNRLLANAYASETERIRKYLNLNGKHPILGYYQVNGAGRMLLSTYEGDDMLALTVEDGDKIIKGLHALRFSMSGNKANYDKLESVAKSITTKMETMLKSVDVDRVNQTAIRNELTYQTKMLTNTMMAIREFVGVASLNALVHGARLVFTLVNKMKEAKQQSTVNP